MRIENTSTRQYDLGAKGFSPVSVPAATTNEHGLKTNGFADVDPEMLKLVKAEAWGHAVFGSGDLVVVELVAHKAEKAEHHEKIEHEDHAKAKHK